MLWMERHLCVWNFVPKQGRRLRKEISYFHSDGQCENLLTYPLLWQSGVSSSAEVNSVSSSFTKCSAFFWWLHKLLYLFLSIQQPIFLLHWKLRPFIIIYQAVQYKLYAVESVHISYIFTHNRCCCMFWYV